MATNYLMWIAATGPGYCTVTRIQNYDASWDLIRGRSLQGKLTGAAQYVMSPREPRAIKLADCIENSDGTIIASKRVADFLRSKEIRGVEYVPVSIINHKGRVATDDYWMVNILAIQDCLDLAQCKPTYNAINAVEIDTVEKFVLEEAKLDPAFALFRCKNFYDHIVVAPQLAAELEQQAFNGLWFRPISKYTP
jgi:hypothetical protein